MAILKYPEKGDIIVHRLGPDIEIYMVSNVDMHYFSLTNNINSPILHWINHGFMVFQIKKYEVGEKMNDLNAPVFMLNPPFCKKSRVIVQKALYKGLKTKILWSR